VDKRDFVRILDEWSYISKELNELCPCHKCLKFVYSYDGENLVKICDKSCDLIKNFDELYIGLRDLYIKNA
jgi:hypothetical protein